MTTACAGKAAIGQRPRWTGRTRGGYFGNWFFITLVRRLGVRTAYIMVVPVAAYFMLAAAGARRAVLAYHARLGLGGGPIRRWWRGYRHFVVYGQMLLDRVAIHCGQEQKYEITREGEAVVGAALAQGRGLVILSGHCGNWELAIRKLRLFTRPVNVVVYRGELAAITRMVDRLSQDLRPRLIEADGTMDAALAIVGALARGEIVAMHADRAVGAMATETVNFLGAPARFPTGPYLVALAAKAPIVHAFGMRVGPFHYHFIAKLAAAPEETHGITRREQVLGGLRQYVAELERQARAFPLQWQNFYEFWESGQEAAG